MMNHDQKTSYRTRLAATAFGVLAVTASLLPAMSYAQQQYGYASKAVHLRAGPSRDYPLVATLAPRTSLTVIGCLPDYRWCDIAAGPYRGWAHSSAIAYAYQGSYVPLLTYGPAIGIGVTTFILGNYWDDYYRSYPWYPQRQRWVDRSPYYGNPGQRPPGVQVRPVAPRPPQDTYPYPAQRPPHQNQPPAAQAPQMPQAPTTRPTPAERPAHPEDRIRNFER